MLPSKNITLLKLLTSKKITNVERQIYIGDNDLSDFEQNADGPIQLTLDGGMIVYFFAITELNSIGLSANLMPTYGDSYKTIDVTRNYFWRSRINKSILEIHILQSIYASKNNPSEFGVEFIFSDRSKVCFEYLDEEEHLDMIRVIDAYMGKCNRRKVT